MAKGHEAVLLRDADVAATSQLGALCLDANAQPTLAPGLPESAAPPR